MNAYKVIKIIIASLVGACASYITDEILSEMMIKADEMAYKGLTWYEFATWIVGRFGIRITVGAKVAKVIFALL